MGFKNAPENLISLSFLQEASTVMRDSKSEKKLHCRWKTLRFGEFSINLTVKYQGFKKLGKIANFYQD